MSGLFMRGRWRNAARALRREPTSAALVIGAQALGAAATITLFAFVSAIFLEPLPYPEPGQIVRVQENHAEISARGISYPNFLDWQADNESFTAMSTARELRMTFSAGAGTRAATSRTVAAGYFDALGVYPAIGRSFTADENRHGAPLTAIVSHTVWQTDLGGRADAMGAAVTIDGETHTVVGIMPASPVAPGDPEMFVLSGQRASPGSAWTQRSNRAAGFVLARLKPGVSIEQAAADMNRIAERLARDYAYNGEHTVEVVPLREALYGNLRAPVLVSFAAVGLLLLIVCVNVSNLLLIRATARRPEFAVRAALGAGTSQIVRQVIEESAVLALIGTGLGLLLAAGATRVLAAALPASLSNGAAPGIDPTVAAFSVALLLAVTVATGLPPALRAVREDFGRAVGAGSRTTRRDGRLLDGLTVAQVALALALMLCATLLADTMARLAREDYGFDPAGVLTFRVLTDAQADRAATARTLTRVIEAVGSVRGVDAAALVQELPGREPRWQTDINPESSAPRVPGELINVDWAVVSGGYFDLLSIPLAAGRPISEQDAADGRPVMMIDENLARRFWPNGDAIGKHIRYDSTGPIEIIGVAATVRAFGRAEPGRIKIYTPYARFPLPNMAVMIRTRAGDPLALVPQVRAALERAVPGIAIFDVSTLPDELSTYVAPRTITTSLIGLFAALATALAALGIYSVVSYAALQRSRELVIRMALGAQTAQLVRLVARKGVVLALVGVAIGAAAGTAASRVLASLVFEAEAASSTIPLATAVAFAAVALAASLVPAWRARTLEPARAIRGD